MAQIYSFKYTDAKGKISDRVLVASVVPSTMYEGIDVTELDEEERGLFIAALDAIKERNRLEFLQLNMDFDLNHKYRQFKAERMTDVTIESI